MCVCLCVCGKQIPEILLQSQAPMPPTQNVSNSPSICSMPQAPHCQHTPTPTDHPPASTHQALGRVVPGAAGFHTVLVTLPLSTFIPTVFFLWTAMQPNHNRQYADISEDCPGKFPERKDERQSVKLKCYLFYLLNLESLLFKLLQLKNQISHAKSKSVLIVCLKFYIFILE